MDWIAVGTGESFRTLLHLGGTKLSTALALRYQLLFGSASSTSPKLSTFQYFVARDRLKLDALPLVQKAGFCLTLYLFEQ